MGIDVNGSTLHTITHCIPIQVYKYMYTYRRIWRYISTYTSIVKKQACCFHNISAWNTSNTLTIIENYIVVSTSLCLSYTLEPSKGNVSWTFGVHGRWSAKYCRLAKLLSVFCKKSHMVRIIFQIFWHPQKNLNRYFTGIS